MDARENGCPWGDKVIEYATAREYTEFENWARDNGYPE